MISYVVVSLLMPPQALVPSFVCVVLARRLAARRRARNGSVLPHRVTINFDAYNQRSVCLSQYLWDLCSAVTTTSRITHTRTQGAGRVSTCGLDSIRWSGRVAGETDVLLVGAFY